MNIAAEAAGAADVVLMYMLAARLFRSRLMGAVAALLLLTDPAHFDLSRRGGVDGIWVVPFVLMWLLALTEFLRTRRRWQLVASAVALFAGFYTQPSAPVLVLLLAVASAAVLLITVRVSVADLQPVAIASGLMFMPLAIWIAFYPRRYPDTFGRWLLHPAYIRNPVEWLRAMSSWFSWTVWVTTWWELFNPSFLFANEQSRAFAGVFLFPVGLLIGWGLCALLRAPSDYRTRHQHTALLLASLTIVLAFATAASFKEPRAIQRALVVTPAGVLLAVYGIDQIWRRSASGRALAVALLAASLAQFAFFFPK